MEYRMHGVGRKTNIPPPTVRYRRGVHTILSDHAGHEHRSCPKYGNPPEEFSLDEKSGRRRLNDREWKSLLKEPSDAEADIRLGRMPT